VKFNKTRYKPYNSKQIKDYFGNTPLGQHQLKKGDTSLMADSATKPTPGRSFNIINNRRNIWNDSVKIHIVSKLPNILRSFQSNQM
jgi:acyl-coenzyme A synthetase/AMP-(fatty) acid ligase